MMASVNYVEVRQAELDCIYSITATQTNENMIGVSIQPIAAMKPSNYLLKSGQMIMVSV